MNIGTQMNGRYELLSFISPGGMGEVWVAKDLVLERNVAIKMVNDYYIKQNPSAAKILRDEAIAGASLLGNPNIVSILDFGNAIFNDNDNYYIVMEYVNGINLQKWIDEIRKKVDSVTYYNISLLISLEICRAIEFAHKKNIQHRDIKPLNVFLSNQGSIKIGDFGLARFVNAVTRTHTVKNLNSPAYTAPEQWKGEKALKETDLYQLGCTLYQLLTGVLPFEKDNLAAIAYSHITELPIEPKLVSNVISEDLSKKILELLEKEPRNRAALWEVIDCIAQEIQTVFHIQANFTKKTGKQLKLIAEITELGIEYMKNSEVDRVFPDYSEILSEGIELILSGILDFKILKKASEIS